MNMTMLACLWYLAMVVAVIYLQTHAWLHFATNSIGIVLFSICAIYSLKKNRSIDRHRPDPYWSLAMHQSFFSERVSFHFEFNLKEGESEGAIFECGPNPLDQSFQYFRCRYLTVAVWSMRNYCKSYIAVCNRIIHPSCILRGSSKWSFVNFTRKNLKQFITSAYPDNI